eukprot:CAMPEP_0201526078 /NCGR_PEP_ID=MMETSP0161_2-20130828/30559_1 /ASSEMBLY_ACC=CAM_ASM_000251 /TAXON_ID=180227 /ORGANISM="Neoparamoeba aestuarina, Strain SoJaBio B1-5/56/2" /LENGTH=181 /DNA_ID=CAMNT_0047926299 /DNA_START=76 /DNA_END=617 /DNA_ORIENTATION=-
MTNNDFICGPADNPRNLSQWKGVYLDDTHNVIQIHWSHVKLGGSIALQWLPSTVKMVVMEKKEYTSDWMVGTLDLTALPHTLDYLRLPGHFFDGEISLTTLPDKMEYLNVCFNKLGGSLDLTRLPSAMKFLGLSWNVFQGVTDFSQLPASLEVLDVSHNTSLQGVIHLESRESEFANVDAT